MGVPCSKRQAGRDLGAGVVTAPETVPPVERLTYRRAELAALSGLGLSTITNAIAAGDLVATRVGRAVLIDGASARRWLGVAS